ncbi:di-heme oxidoredictase family protein [Polyangium sp. 6x1]|uniref:di-heme oxidoredictase family protein n=1 Tax=Polyangium sp. 6x1 TaxID=3042689 RepID=UPI002482E4EB|nr:di-heme oxidoredictase family protein [Polyangium sp. 6x1]MDI1443901.1 di-heme oxidoredictase family protein [Polyangium sp. 6x1]
MRRSLVLSLVATTLVACALDPTPTPTAQKGTARALGVYTTNLDPDLERQAYDALARDAQRREHRFLDAADPGHLARSIRVEQSDLEAGAHSPEEIFQLGAQIFHATFTLEMGYGGKDLPHLARFHAGRRGGPDAMRCDSCHWRGGPGGAGDAADNAYLDGDGDRQSSALARNPPSLVGAGLVELVAREMSAELGRAREALVARAKAEGKPARGPLVAKGVAFGELEARPDGRLDGTSVLGVDTDLVVKPFGWKGHFASLRDVVEDELNVHHGMQSTWLVAHGDPARVGAFGGTDPDGDGITDEVREGQVTALVLFLAMQEVPVTDTPVDQDHVVALGKGEARFQALGCATCHVPSLTLESAVYSLPSREGGAPIRVDLQKDAALPRIAPPFDGGPLRLYLYSDLKRHDMGPGLAEREADRAVRPGTFLTRPLWGIARSRPYLHDARAPTLEDAILLHGGEAQAARDAFAALSEPERGELRVFLTSLTRARRLSVP